MQTLKISSGKNKTIYSHVNATGYVYLKISNESRTNQGKLWLVKGQFGIVEKIGTINGTGKLKIRGTLWGKLKAIRKQTEE